MALAGAQMTRLRTQWSSGATFVSPESPRVVSPSFPQTPQTPRPVDEQELDRSRIEAMETLASVLKRNTRVRYEIGVVEVITAYVFPLALQVGFNY